MLAKIGVKLPLIPWKIPVYYWRASQFLPHTFIYDSGSSRAGHVWGLPEQEYPGLVKVTEKWRNYVDFYSATSDLSSRGSGV